MSIRSLVASGFLAVSLLVPQGPAVAEDIDLFVQPPGAASTGVPNVLLMVDNTANWNPMFTAEIDALVSTFNNLTTNPDGTARFRVGVMFATETGQGNNNVTGGYVRAAIRPMTAANKALYAEMFRTLDNNRDQGNGGASSLSMAEAYLYFTGGTPYAGNRKAKTDFTGNDTSDFPNATSAASRAAMLDIYQLTGNALASKNATQYISPIPDGYCGKNFIIYISNGANQESNSRSVDSEAIMVAAGGNTSEIPISPSGSSRNPSDEWARFMYESLGVVTYTVDVDKILTGQGPGWTALLKSMASVSNGQYFDVSSSSGTSGAEIAEAVGTILSLIQSVNSVFASVSLPVSVNTEGTYLNQVYIGMFRPNANAFPLWAGNLKQYKLGVVGTALRTLDADEASAINSNTGFIAECARSFWTPTTADSYWAFRPQGGCLTVANSDASNYPDGNVVEKGAQAYKLRSTTTRTMQTCAATSFGACTTLTNFATGNAAITQALLGAGSAAERDALINWQRGQDLTDENINSVTAAEMRPSAHGDVVHSRPVAINLGTDAAPKVVVFYGGNDGVLRAVNGNRGEPAAQPIGSIAAGSELWAFVAPEFYPYIKRLRDNDVQIDFQGNTTTSPVPQPKPYGFDGPISVYRDAANAWIFPAMRRGGRALYAFDVSNLAANTPSGPTLKWKVGCASLVDDADCTTGMTDIGQTWSAPKVIKTSGYMTTPVAPAIAVAKPMLIMGGGYDTCEDADPNTCTAASKGDHIYVLDADTGTRLATLDTERGVIGDVFVISNATGLAQWAYAADLGGNIYRISGADENTPFNDTPPDEWTITKIADLGCATTANCSANRKFMFAPDILEKDGTYYLLVGSGDREKPLRDWPSAYGVSNYFFMLKDVPTDSDWLDDESTTCGSDVICLNSLLGITTSADPDAASLAAKKGWYLGLNPHEQVVTSAITVFGTTTFSTHTPTVLNPGACVSNLGTARVYNIGFANARSRNGTSDRSQVISGGGLPPSPVAGLVTLDDGRTVPFLIGGDPDSPLETVLPTGPATGSQPKSLTYWYIQK